MASVSFAGDGLHVVDEWTRAAGLGEAVVRDPPNVREDSLHVDHRGDDRFARVDRFAGDDDAAVVAAAWAAGLEPTADESFVEAVVVGEGFRGDGRHFKEDVLHGVGEDATDVAVPAP